MNRLEELSEALIRGRKLYEDALVCDDAETFHVREIYGSSVETADRIAAGDNFEYMIHLIKNKDMSGCIQLIYVDPPFFSKGKYQASIRLESEKLGVSKLIKTGAYDDWSDSELQDYLTMLAAGLNAMKELLADTGSICVHIDWHVSHYVRLMLDSIFGEKNFINEIIWTYKSGGTGRRSFAKKHDTLFLYGKSGRYVFNRLKEKSYNRGFKPYRFKGVEEFCDDTGWYTMVNMKDVWNIDMVGRTSAERTGYATQKPEKLMERIITACSGEGDLCADFFAGSGSFGAVCERMNRHWIMCDKGDVASASQIMRLAGQGAQFSVERPAGDTSSTGLRCILTGSGVGLDGYDADEESICCSDKEEVVKYMHDDPMSLIRFWSVDFDNGGGIHRAETVHPGSVREITGDRDVKAGSTSVIAYDVFGRGLKCRL